jgi:steroid 5-alpha reductase family enzyme
MADLFWRAAFSGLGVIVVLAVLTWLVSLARRDVSIVDSLWSIFITTGGVVYALLLPWTSARPALMLALAVAWALRLAIYITWRNHGHGEDRRYQQIRARNQPNFAFKSLYLIFGLQAVLAWIVSAPFLAGTHGSNPINALDLAGAALAAFGIVFEAVGDQQMARFKADPTNKGQVMDHGLWRFSRHPNYFGECCTWWGLYLIALAAGGAWWSIVSPLLMTVLLLKVSGVTLLEADIGERRPAYRDYIARTPAFVPWWPRRKEGA